MNDQAIPRKIRNTMQELESRGFQPLGTRVTQGLGLTGRALSADGSTWADIGMLQSGLRNSWRQLLKTGVLRGAGCTAQFTTEFNNQTYLVTTNSDLAPSSGIEVERLPADTAPAAIALRHMQRIEQYLREHQPLRLVIQTCAAEIEAALRRAHTVYMPQPLTVATLQDLGVPAHLALLIAGDCAETAEPLPL
jgi:hypothetical protein